MQTNTTLASLWSLGWPRLGSIKRVKQLRDMIGICRVAVEYKHLHKTNPSMAFTSSKWRFQRHIDKTKLPHWLCVLFESPGADNGAGFKRGAWSQPGFSEFRIRLSPWLNTGHIKVLELGNEFGVVAQGAERMRRFEYLLGLAEKVAPWLADKYPNVDLVIGGLHSLFHTEGLASYVVENGSRFLRKHSYIDFHTFDDPPERVVAAVGEFRARGWEPVIGEEFRQPANKQASFTGTSDVVRAAVNMELKYVAVFTGFYEREWGDAPPRTNTFHLAVTGPGGNVRDGGGAEPDHWSELKECARIVADGPQPLPLSRQMAVWFSGAVRPGWNGAVGITADRKWRADWISPDGTKNGERFNTIEGAMRRLEEL